MTGNKSTNALGTGETSSDSPGSTIPANNAVPTATWPPAEIWSR